MTAFLDRPGPRWFSIPAHRPFAQDLAAGLIEALGPDPEALSQAIVLTPTRRGARSLADAFVGAGGGKAILPPQMRPLGDLEEGEPPFEPGDLALDLPAAIEPLRRRFELTRLVAENHHLLPGREMTASAALELADALGGFLDSLQIEEIEAGEKLAGLVEAELAEHWRVSRDFLETALALWPQRLKDLGLVDVSERRVILLRRLAEAWDARPPEGVLVAAGSTGTAPATANLLAVIARAPQGCVVLPGLDESLSDAAWADVGEQHPQGAMKRLLQRSGIERGAVEPWPASFTFDAAGRWRQRVINEALRPAERTADWLEVITDLTARGEDEKLDGIALGLAGLSLVSARSEEEAATVAALLLREALEDPARTAALVAPDQALARRVAAKLARWGVVPDNSAGEPLAGHPCGVLAGLVARAAVDPLDPITLLAILKHPYVKIEGEAETQPKGAAALERYGLRGPRARSWDEIEARLRSGLSSASANSIFAHPRESGDPGVFVPASDLPPSLGVAQPEKSLGPRFRGDERNGGIELLRRLKAQLSALDQQGPDPAAMAAAVAKTMEALAGDLGELWSGHGGEAMSRLLSGLIHDGAGLPPTTWRGFADLLSRLMEGETVRTGGATHPRLRILGAIEARLVRADRLVVAGLEEGVWPRGAPLDPFLSRPMRTKLGLPPPERRVGLSAHDFAQAACAPEVILLHSERREGAPAVKSRWLWRLETLARGAGVEIPQRPDVLDWARRLDAPGAYAPEKRPSPKPPVEHRPTSLFVTRVEALTRDPYSVWARDILNLRELSPPDETVDVRLRGTAIHAAFERFATDFPDHLPPDAAARFRAYYLEALHEGGMADDALVREQALATEAAAWVVDLEARRRADGRAIHVEKTGRITLAIDGEPFTLSAKADRIEIGPDGLGHVLDYKTGAAPTARMVRTGFSPQLTLTAAILAQGGFEDVAAAEPGELVYVRITGRKPAGEEVVRATPGGDGEKVLDSRTATDAALEGLVNLVRQYRDPERGYTSRLAPQFVKLYASDYDHLARVFEWSTSGEEGDE